MTHWTEYATKGCQLCGTDIPYLWTFCLRCEEELREEARHTCPVCKALSGFHAATCKRYISLRDDGRAKTGAGQ